MGVRVPSSVLEDLCLGNDEDLTKDDDIVSKVKGCIVKKSRDSL